MPTVTTSVFINAPLAKVYAIAQDYDAFPEFMEDVESLRVLERDSGRVVSEWVGRVPAFGLKVRWTQEDHWDDAQLASAFKMLKGDYDKMEGSWRFTEENGGTRFDSVLEYEYVVPGLGPLVGKVIYGLVVKNMEGVLDAIRRRAEANPSA